MSLLVRVFEPSEAPDPSLSSLAPSLLGCAVVLFGLLGCGFPRVTLSRPSAWNIVLLCMILRSRSSSKVRGL